MIPTQERRAAFTAGLRRMADFIDAMRPETPVDMDLTHSTYFYESIRNPITNELIPGGTPEAMASLVALLGNIEKRADDSYFRVFKNFDGGVKMEWFAARERVCHAKVVGTRTIPATPERVIAAEPEKVEEVVEWDCPSLLRMRRPATVEVPHGTALATPEPRLLGDGEPEVDSPF